jgi:hypothetical protein
MALTQILTTDSVSSSIVNTKIVDPANAHINSTSNPHGVTKEQIGLTNVTNDAQIPKSIIEAAGDLIYGTADNTPARLAKGTDGQLLKLISGLPAWSDGVRVVTGTYVGNAVNDRIIDIGFQPKIVFITSYTAALGYSTSITANVSGGGTSGYTNYNSGYMSASSSYSSSNVMTVALVATGFKVYGNSNTNSATFNYVAIG